MVEGGIPGTWQRYRGILLSGVTADDEAVLPEDVIDGTFLFKLMTEEEISARVYEQTRIFAVRQKTDGGGLPVEGIELVEIGASDLQAGDRAVVEAVRVEVPAEPEEPEPTPADDALVDPVYELRVAIMVALQGEAAPGPDLLRGKIESVNPTEPVSADAEVGNEGTLSVISSETSNAVCVDSSADTAIYLAVGTEDSIDLVKVSLGSLQPGQLISIVGDAPDVGCFNAALMIARGSTKP